MKIEDFEGLAKIAGLSKEEIETFKIIESLSEGSINGLTDYLQAQTLANENQTPFIMPSEEVKGEINFALTQDNKEVGISPEEPHMLIAGMTRSGKTILLLKILSEILEQQENTRIWLFTKTKEGRKLLNIRKDIVVVTFDTSVMFSTQLAPQNVHQNTFNIIWSDNFIQAFGIYDGTKNFMIEHLKRLFSRKQNPLLKDLYYQIRNTKYPLMSRYARYQESALNRLGGLLSSPISKAINCGYPSIEILSKLNVVYEIQHLTAQQQVFFVNILMSWLYYYKLYNDSDITHFIGIDDANLLFDRSFENRPDQGLPQISHLLSTVAKSKIVIACGTQIPHQLGASIHSNSFTKIMFALSNGKDIECMIQSMGITDPEQRQYCYQLAPQGILIKFSGRYQEPFLACVPFTSFPEEPSDEEIKTNNKRIMPFLAKDPKVTEQVIIQPDEEKEEKKVDKKETIASDLRQFLMAVYIHLFYSITEHYSDLNLSAGKGNRIVKTLVTKGLCKIVEINTGKRGGLKKFLEIMPEGYRAINMPPLKYTKGTSFIHWYWQKQIAANLQKLENTKVTVEANLKDKFIDLFVEYIKDNKKIKIAIEISITSTPKDEKTNIIKDLESGADFVIIACSNNKKLEGINQMIASLDTNYVEKTGSCLLPQLLRTDDIIEFFKL